MGEELRYKISNDLAEQIKVAVVENCFDQDMCAVLIAAGLDRYCEEFRAALENIRVAIGTTDTPQINRIRKTIHTTMLDEDSEFKSRERIILRIAMYEAELRETHPEIYDHYIARMNALIEAFEAAPEKES